MQARDRCGLQLPILGLERRRGKGGRPFQCRQAAARHAGGGGGCGCACGAAAAALPGRAAACRLALTGFVRHSACGKGQAGSVA